MGHFMNFNNSDYINITTDLIYDIFYSDISSRGRISSIRQYSEILTLSQVFRVTNVEF